MNKFNDFLKEQLKDPEFKKEYDALQEPRIKESIEQIKNGKIIVKTLDELEQM